MEALSVSELRFAGYILISFLQTRLNPQSPRPAMIRIAIGGPTCPDRTPIIITPTGPVPMHMVTIPITRDRVAGGASVRINVACAEPANQQQHKRDRVPRR